MTEQLTLYPRPEGRGFTVRFGNYYTEKNRLKDKQKNVYNIQDIMVNGKKYNGMDNLCLDVENTISYKINKNIK